MTWDVLTVLWHAFFLQLRVVSHVVCDIHRSYLTSHGEPSYASFCSGCESPALAFRSLNWYLNGQLNWTHAFSCEVDARKAKFIEQAFNVPLCFKDVCHLFRKSAYCWRADDNKPVPVDDIDGGIGGFVCKDVNTLNARSNFDALQKRKTSKKTAATFYAICKWLKRAMVGRQFKYLLLENVCGVDMKKRSHVKQRRK